MGLAEVLREGGHPDLATQLDELFRSGAARELNIPTMGEVNGKADEFERGAELFLRFEKMMANAMRQPTHVAMIEYFNREGKEVFTLPEIAIVIRHLRKLGGGIASYTQALTGLLVEKAGA